jgi:DNA invertase Pin-like site-specific DNA recombinase
MTVYGYARVLTEGQSLTAQVPELKVADCQGVFREKIGGAWADRNQLARLLAELDDGDTVIVTRLDRLARSTRDLLNTLAAIGAAAQAVDPDGAWWAGRVRAAPDRCAYQ